MAKKSLRLRFIDVPAFFVFCLLLVWPVQAQPNKYFQKSMVDLYTIFDTARKMPCGERGEAILAGRAIIERLGDNSKTQDYVNSVRKQVAAIETEDKLCNDKSDLTIYFENFNVEQKKACGERFSAVSLGKRIIEEFGDDAANQEVIEFVSKQIPVIEEQDRICQRNNAYNNAYKQQNWPRFLEYSKQIIDEEGDSRLALDTMLSFVAVGYKLTAYGRISGYNGDTLLYAQKAIDLIESGVRTKARWGNVEPYETKQKALAWMNYVIGYISYFRNRAGKKAIPYFYKATQYSAEFKYDAFVYQAVAIHYFEKQAVTVSSLTINDFLSRAGGLVSEPNDAPYDADSIEIAVLYKQLVNLYNLRYNLEPNENVTSFTEYILKLISRPLLDTAKTRMSDTTSTRVKN